MLSRIDELKAELGKRNSLTPGEVQRLQDEFVIEYTYNSNAIEGNTLTLQETALVLEGVAIAGKPLKDHLEAVGHRDAFHYVEKLVEGQVPFSESIIKQIYTGLDRQARRSRHLSSDSGEDYGCIPHIARAVSGAGADGETCRRVFKRKAAPC